MQFIQWNSYSDRVARLYLPVLSNAFRTIVGLIAYQLFLKLYIIVSRRVRKAIMPKCKSEGAEMSLRVVSGTWSPNW